MNSLFRIFYIILLLFLVFSCKAIKSSNDKSELVDIKEEIYSINIKMDNIDFFESDYKIINYSEIRMPLINNETFIQKHLEIKITSSEKIMLIKELTEPIIYLNINDRNYLAKGKWRAVSALPNDCDFAFHLDEDRKIWFSENDIIGFFGGNEFR
ncbi:MAG: hypothetical protein LBI28_05370 [Treponema sp.]|jgi:hypothetical protein|nr:hypothetical protein [Treponema sp.]